MLARKNLWVLFSGACGVSNMSLLMLLVVEEVGAFMVMV